MSQPMSRRRFVSMMGTAAIAPLWATPALAADTRRRRA